VIKHGKFFNSNEHFLLLFHLNKECDILLTDLDLQDYFQNVMLKNKY